METDRRRRPDLSRFERDVLATCRSRRLLGPGDAVLVALSGGPDSTALVASLAALRDRGEVGPVAACHVDHQLRPGGAEEAAFCGELCRRLGVPFETAAVEVGAGNLQSAARRARYAALRAAARSARARWIATGHTRSDQAETVLLRLSRGAGARGLSGIAPRNRDVVRPLVDRSRAEVLGYLAERALPFLEDPTNATDRFDRNRVRREILPALERLRPGIEASLARVADLLRDDDRALERRARALVPPGCREARVDLLLGVPRAVRARAVRRLWKAATGSRRALEAHHVESVMKLFRRGRPGAVSLPGGRTATVAGGVLSIARPARPAPPGLG